MPAQYRRCRSHLIEAFLSLEREAPDDDRLRRSIEALVEAVSRVERELGRRSNIVRFPARS